MDVLVREHSANAATADLSRSGVPVAVAAANPSADACTFSPASEPTAVTAAAFDRADNSASFTNRGSCVDLYAPGVAITSTWLNGGIAVVSSTSMVSPRVAGVATLYKSADGETPNNRLRNWIKSAATSGVLNGVPADTPTLLLFKRRL